MLPAKPGCAAAVHRPRARCAGKVRAGAGDHGGAPQSGPDRCGGGPWHQGRRPAGARQRVRPHHWQGRQATNGRGTIEWVGFSIGGLLAAPDAAGPPPDSGCLPAACQLPACCLPQLPWHPHPAGLQLSLVHCSPRRADWCWLLTRRGNAHTGRRNVAVVLIISQPTYEPTHLTIPDLRCPPVVCCH